MNKKSKKIDNKEKQEYDSDEEIVIEEEFGENLVLKKLREKLKKVVKEKQEYLEGWQRTKADLINFKRSEEERRSKILKFAKEDMVLEILPVLDSFNMAKNSDIWEKGLENIYKQLLSILRGNGLKEDNPQGEDFNPNKHEAVEMVKSSSKNDGKIVEVVQNGYLLEERVIRPSRVKVGKFEK